MKRSIKLTALILSMAFLATGLAGCDGGGAGSDGSDGSVENSSVEVGPEDSGGDSEEIGGPYSVTFDLNLEGTGFTDADVTSVRDQTVNHGGYAIYRPLVLKGSPDNPDNLGFKCWATDPDGNNEYDFSSPVTSDLVLYAKWVSRYVVTFHNFSSVIVENVFPGESASRHDGDAGWRLVEGYYTDGDFTRLYDFSSPVTSDLDLYVKLGGIYIASTSIVNFEWNYGNPANKFNADYFSSMGDDAETAAADETSITLVGDDYDTQYVKVHFGASPNAAWISTTTTLFLKDPVTGEREADVMTVTYKNLGPCGTMRFYYVVGYDNGEGSYTHSGGGGWRLYADVSVKANMSEDDDWETVTINLVEATTADGVSEWGTADVLVIPRWEFIDTVAEEWDRATNFHLNNDVLIKGISFNALED